MKDTVIKNTGNSRSLRSVPDFKAQFPTYEDFANALVAGTLPVDIGGLNDLGVNQRGTPLNKSTFLSDGTASALGLTGDDPTVNDALLGITRNGGIADIRTYKAGKDITAGEVLDVQKDGTLNETFTLYDREEKQSTLSTTVIYNVSFSLGNSKFLYVQSSSTGVSTVYLKRVVNGTESSLSNVKIASSGIHVSSENSVFSKVSDDVVALIYQATVYLLSIKNDTLSLMATFDADSDATIISNSNSYAAKISDDEICICGTENENSYYYPSIRVVAGLKSGNPYLKASFRTTNEKYKMIANMHVIQYSGSKFLLAYRGYGTSGLTESLVMRIVDVNSKSFQSEIVVEDWDNRPGNFPHLFRYNNDIYLAEDGSANSGYSGKLLLRKVSVGSSSISLSSQALSSNISVSNNSSFGIAEVFGRVMCVVGTTLYDFSESSGKFQISNTVPLNPNNVSTNANPSFGPQIQELSDYSILVTATYMLSEDSTYAYFAFFFSYYNGEFNKSPDFSSRECIALQTVKKGADVEAIFSGTTRQDWVKANQVIEGNYGGGVYGIGILDGLLQVWSADRPEQVVDGSYIGNGLYGAASPITLNFSLPPKAILLFGVKQSDAEGSAFAIFVNGMKYAQYIGYDASSPQAINAQWNGTEFSFYSTTNSARQFNYPGVTYKYIAIL